MKNFILLLIANIFLSSVAFADCISVSGLQFERISAYELLASRNGKNVAVLNVSCCSNEIPAKINTFRFFSEELCTTGAEARFHIDGRLYYLANFIYFKN
jgi:hypothetical protein